MMTSTGQKVLLGAGAIAAAGLAAGYLLSRPSASNTPEIQKYEPASKRIKPEMEPEEKSKRQGNSRKLSKKGGPSKSSEVKQTSSSQQPPRLSNEFDESIFVRQRKVFNQLFPLVRRAASGSSALTAASKKTKAQLADAKPKRKKTHNQKPTQTDDEVFGPTYAHSFATHPTDNTDGIVSDLRGNMSDNVIRLQKLSDEYGITSSRFVRTPVEYYDWPLEQRRDLLKAPSTSYLCKSLIVSNTKCIYDNCDHPENSKYYLVVYQYVERFNSEKVKQFVRRLSNFEVGRKKFNFQLAPEAVSDEISGFKHNGVTPLGMKQTNVPVILSHKILDLGFVWLGGGEFDVKWAVNVNDFRNHFRPYVADVTD